MRTLFFRRVRDAIVIATAIAGFLFTLPAQSTTVSATEDDLTLTFVMSDSITNGLDQNWGSLRVQISEGDYDLSAGDDVLLAVYDNDGYIFDSELWSNTFEVTNAEANNGGVDRTFDIFWLAYESGFEGAVYAYAEVDKYWSYSWADDDVYTDEVSVAVEPPSAVPVPAAAWLLGSALFGLLGVARRRANA
ncbi:MAG: VPLPA-CTERM sorting domain-containing protein [Halioglobus sp.]|nr:VPLPA-CTERM sorting domain-containing protein [Halioglobus sp.]